MNIDLSPALQRIHSITRGLIAALPNLFLAAILFIVFLLAAIFIKKVVARIVQRRARTWSGGLALGRISQGVVILLGLLVSLSVASPTFKPADVVQLLGIGSVAIGFAFRDIFQNFLAGILLLLTRPFRIGDQIVMGNFEGTVEDIQTRATFIRTYDGRRVVIPNTNLFTNSVTVNTAFDKRRVEYDFGIGYGDDIERAKSIILECIRSQDEVLQDPSPDVIVVALGTYNVNIRARWWIQPPKRSEFSETRDKVLAEVKRRLFENGIDLPFPIQHILFHDQTEETDGDRLKQREGWPAGAGKIPKPHRIADSILLAGAAEAKADPRS